MNKADLVNAVAKDTGLTKTDAQAVIESVLSNVIKGAKKEPVGIVGFGTFKTVNVKARTVVNPQTGAKMKVPAKKAIKFKISKNLSY